MVVTSGGEIKIKSKSKSKGWSEMSAWFFRGVLLLACFVGRSEAAGAVRVFVLVGQSNMQGHAHVRTLPHLSSEPETAEVLSRIQNVGDTFQMVDGVWISSLQNDGERSGPLGVGFGANEEKIGPELGFGLRMRELVDGPVVLIKTAWGGKSLHTDFRSPSGGAYVFSDNELARLKQNGKSVADARRAKDEATGHYYRLMIDHVKGTLRNLGNVFPDYPRGEDYHLAGFVWFQGWNDMVDRGVYPDRDKAGGYDMYSELLAHFIRDVRRDLNSPGLPFVIGVFGVGGPVEDYPPGQKRYAGIHSHFRNAMLAPSVLPEFSGNVAAVKTELYWDSELTRLRGLESAARNRFNQWKKDKDLARKELQEAQKRFFAEGLTAEERETLRLGVSNAEYHYLGSSKIMVKIGMGFADAVHGLTKAE